MGEKATEARKKYANLIDQRRSARSEKTKSAMDDYKSMISERRKYGDVLRAQMTAKENMRSAEQERERKKRASVWSNLALMGAGIGAAFGPVGAAVGGALGTGVGMASAAARGGNPFDMSAQFEYLQPSMVGFAAQGISGAIKGAPVVPTTASKAATTPAWAQSGDYQLQLGSSGSPLTSGYSGAPSSYTPSAAQPYANTSSALGGRSMSQRLQQQSQGSLYDLKLGTAGRQAPNPYFSSGYSSGGF